MNRRSFLSFLGISPLIGLGVVKASPDVVSAIVPNGLTAHYKGGFSMTATEVQNRYGVYLDDLPNTYAANLRPRAEKWLSIDDELA